ncbi:MAG: M1 family aminopeptidase, partial [Gemmatimonas sp.]
VFALAQPLVPGDSLNVTFDVSLRRRAFGNARAPASLASNGTWIDRRFLPFVGYQPQVELESGRERFGLGTRPTLPTAANPGNALNHQQILGDADLVHADVTIGTSDDQVAFTAGQLRRTWTENGRRYFRYETTPPTSVAGGYFSARYAVKEDRAGAVALRILHDPREGDNVDRMMRGMKASLAYYSTQFGSYPDSTLSIVEVPRYSIFGVALPTSMAFSEDAFHSRVKDGEIDQPFYGVAHEVAHHWWGGMANPAPVTGAGLISESLANYSAMMVMEKTFGVDIARRVYASHMDRYLSGRAEYSREVPVVNVSGQPYLSYRKGAVAMYTMRDMIGEQAVNGALRRYLAKFRHKGPPYPTSLELVAELRAATPDSMQYLIEDLFETVTLYEVKTDSATVVRAGDGKYQVTLVVDVKKLRADSVGRQIEVPMNDFVDIGVFGEGKDGALGTPIYLERRRLRGGRQTLRMMVDREPKRAGVDPYDKTIDRERGDNVRALTVVSSRVGKF